METSQEVIFRCFASGSSGNCYYLGSKDCGILIDAGISARTIFKYLQQMNLDFTKILAVLVTHDHADHIRAVGTLGEKVHLPIYATETIHKGIDRNYGVSVKLRTSRKYFVKGEPFEISAGGTVAASSESVHGGEPLCFKINSFEVSHDSSECVGYCIDVRGRRFVIITDCGEPNPQMEDYIRTANHIVIEANHDEQMLLNGPYPTYLKERILSPKGHQSNVVCGELLEHNYHNGLKHIFLCHLSEENNDPQLAYQTVRDHLLSAGANLLEDVPKGEHVPQGKTLLKALDRLDASPVYLL